MLMRLFFVFSHILFLSHVCVVYVVTPHRESSKLYNKYTNIKHNSIELHYHVQYNKQYKQ